MGNVYVCRKCLGRTGHFVFGCPRCGQINSLYLSRKKRLERNLKPSLYASELEEENADMGRSDRGSEPAQALTLADVSDPDHTRLHTGIDALDATFGDVQAGEGGVVAGSCILLSGDPGAGKSTLLFQMGQAFSKSGLFVYVAAEESAERIASRARRLLKEAVHPNFKVVESTSWESVAETLKQLRPNVFIVDSINVMQTSHSRGAVNSTLQLKALGPKIYRFCSDYGCTAFIIDHVTKSGIAAGPKSLEHDVDVLAHLYNLDKEDEATASTNTAHAKSGLRKLSLSKNRFGPTHIETFFKMTRKGLVVVTKPLPPDVGSTTVLHRQTPI